MKKRIKGDSSFISAVFIMQYLLLMFIFLFRMRILEYEAGYIDNGLSAAILASAYLNIEEYGISNQIVIHDLDIGKDLVGNATEETFRGRESTDDEHLRNTYFTFINDLAYNLGLHVTGDASDIHTDMTSDKPSVLRGVDGSVNSKVAVLDYRVYNVYIDKIKRKATLEELQAAGLANADDMDDDEIQDAFVDDIPDVSVVVGDKEFVAINGTFYVVDGYIKSIYEFKYAIGSDGSIVNIELAAKRQCLAENLEDAMQYDLGIVTPGGEKVYDTTVYARIGLSMVTAVDAPEDGNSPYIFYKEKERAVNIQTAVG